MFGFGTEHELRILQRRIERLERHLYRDEETLKFLLELEEQEKPRSSKLSFKTSKGDETSMPLTVHVNDVPGVAVYQEFSGPNGSGIVVPPTGTVAYASDTPAVATVDPVTGQLAYLSAGTATISASDGGNLPASDVLTVSAATAVSSTLALNPGVAPSPLLAAVRKA